MHRIGRDRPLPTGDTILMTAMLTLVAV